MGQYKGKVLKNEKVSDTVWKLTLNVHEEQNLEYKAGQFLIVKLPLPDGAAKDEKNKQGFYSVASAPAHGGNLEFLIEHGADGGEVSQWMTQRKKGEKLVLEGPLGKLEIAESKKRPQLFLGFRAGVAPLRALIQAALGFPGENPVYLFLGGQGVNDLILDSEWQALAKENSRFHYIPSPDPAATLLAEISERNGMDVYMAGFKRELDPMRDVLMEAGFPKSDLRMENFG